MRPYSELSTIEQNDLVAIAIISATLFDLANGFLIEKIKSPPNKEYIRFHQEHDIIKTTILKCCALIIFLDITYSGIRFRFAPEIFSIIYLAIVAWNCFNLIRCDFIRDTTPEHKEPLRDRIATVFIDPFLRKRDRPYSIPDKKSTWSWWGFFIPELWLLWNEIYGLGLLLIGFYFFVYPHIPFHPSSSLLLWTGVRTIIGLKGNLLIEAKKSNTQT
ncbi:MAG TPA: DUF2628 domain-containing protein [Desulfobulbus sp.]|nr:DUF2628 domain-containing protein [Desulfobulbus sp.]